MYSSPSAYTPVCTARFYIIYDGQQLDHLFVFFLPYAKDHYYSFQLHAADMVR